jgi:hypothetical protein
MHCLNYTVRGLNIYFYFNKLKSVVYKNLLTLVDENIISISLDGGIAGLLVQPDGSHHSYGDRSLKQMG